MARQYPISNNCALVLVNYCFLITWEDCMSKAKQFSLKNQLELEHRDAFWQPS